MSESQGNSGIFGLYSLGYWNSPHGYNGTYGLQENFEFFVFVTFLIATNLRTLLHHCMGQNFRPGPSPSLLTSTWPEQFPPISSPDLAQAQLYWSIPDNFQLCVLIKTQTMLFSSPDIKYWARPLIFFYCLLAIVGRCLITARLVKPEPGPVPKEFGLSLPKNRRNQPKGKACLRLPGKPGLCNALVTAAQVAHHALFMPLISNTASNDTTTVTALRCVTVTPIWHKFHDFLVLYRKGATYSTLTDYSLKKFYSATRPFFF